MSLFGINVHPGSTRTDALLPYLKRGGPLLGLTISTYIVSCSSWFKPLGMASCSYWLFQMYCFKESNPLAALKPDFEKLQNSNNEEDQKFAQLWLKRIAREEIGEAFRKTTVWLAGVACGILAIVSTVDLVYFSIFMSPVTDGGRRDL